MCSSHEHYIPKSGLLVAPTYISNRHVLLLLAVVVIPSVECLASDEIGPGRRHTKALKDPYKRYFAAQPMRDEVLRERQV